MGNNKPVFDDKFMQEMFKRQIDNKLKTFSDLNKTAKKKGILFVGDSITEGYPLHELFIDRCDIYNRGIGGVTSAYILENIQTMILDLEPELMFLMIGTNDLFFESSPAQIAGNIKAICDKTREALPNIVIHVISVYPIDEEHTYEGIVQGARTNEGLLEVNRNILSLLQWSDSLKYIDMHSVLKGDTGNLIPDYTTDGLHLSIKGYHRVSEVISGYIG